MIGNHTPLNEGILAINESLVDIDSFYFVRETNNLLKQLITTNQEGNSLQKKKPELSPVGLYEVQ